MSRRPHFQLTSRRHANGVVAVVVYLGHAGEFVASALSPGQTHYGVSARSEGQARAIADQTARCPQPCTCDAWPEFKMTP